MIGDHSGTVVAVARLVSSEAGIAWRLAINARNLDAGKQYGKCRVKGRKRHILVDNQGLLMHVLVHAGDVRDRDSCVVVMATSFGLYPFLLKLYADGGYQGPEFQAGLKKAIPGEHRIVRRSGRAKGFVVLPRRWIAERTFAWFGRCRRLARDWECLNAKTFAFVKLASIHLMIRRLCNPS